MTEAGLTVLDLAARIGKPVTWVRALLEEDERRGLVRRVGDRWLLTEEAERRHGLSLRRAGDGWAR
jgi:hypothetical protein